MARACPVGKLPMQVALRKFVCRGFVREKTPKYLSQLRYRDPLIKSSKRVF